jgi:hypothetical protein
MKRLYLKTAAPAGLSQPRNPNQDATTSRVARCAALAAEEPLADDRVKRGGACLRAHDFPLFQRRAPSHPQEFWPAALHFMVTSKTFCSTKV